MTVVRKRFAIGVLLFASGLLFGFEANGLKDAENGYKQQKVVYHINDLEKAGGALRNVSNHLGALGDENAQIAVVTHGRGALILVEGTQDGKGKSFDSMIQAFANRGVSFQICANTIKGLQIDESKINLNAQVVPSGVAQVAHLQQQGYLYVKP